MIQRLLYSKNFLACLLAAATGLVLYIKMPFPEDNFFFELMFLFARPIFNGFKYRYILFLYTTPYICYSILLSGLYIFALKIPQRIPDAQRRLEEPSSPLVSAQDYGAHSSDLGLFDFTLDESLEMYRAKATPGLRRFLQEKSVPFEALSEAGFDEIDPDRQEQLAAVKRWSYDDWRRIEPKLRISIVEGISVFLSLFDDNPAAKRTFCPPPECYDPKANADHRFGEPLSSFSLDGKALTVAGKPCRSMDIARRLGEDISEAKPILGSRLLDGSRVAAAIPLCVWLNRETFRVEWYNQICVFDADLCGD